MSKGFWKTGIYVLVLASLILAACGGGGAPAPATTTQPEAPKAEATEAPAVVATEAPKEEQAAPGDRKVATFIFTQEFDSLNPHYTNMWFSQITHQIWNCWAWDFDGENQPHPVMVSEMPSKDNGGISEDNLTITMKLRDDMKWSDGEPLNAKDFVFTYDMIVNPANTVASTYPYELLESVTATDDTTLVMRFKEPFAAWVGTLWRGLMPQHVLQPVIDAEGNINNAEWNRNPTVGCGPYNFQEWESGSFARFTKNDSYWLGAPKIDEIFIRFVPDDASQVAALKNAEGDIGTFIAYSDVPDLQSAGVEIVQVFSGYNEGWYFMLDPEKGHPGLLDVKVRQAIAYAFDREAITKDLLLGLTQPAATYWDNTPYVDPALKPYPFDPEKAKTLLDEAGWVDSNGDGTRDKDGTELVLKYGTTTREIRTDTQAVAQQQLADVGIGVELLTFDSDIFFNDYANGGPAATGSLDIFEYSTVTNFPDPDTSEWLCSEIPSDDSPQGLNWMYLCDQTLNDLFMKQGTQVDFTERQQTFYQITKLIYDNVYWLGVWQDPDTWAVSNRLANVVLSGATPFWNINEWDLK